MADISNLKINESSNVERPSLRELLEYKMKIVIIKRRNSFILKGKYENRENCESCGISNGRTIPKLAHF